MIVGKSVLFSESTLARHQSVSRLLGVVLLTVRTFPIYWDNFDMLALEWVTVM